MTQEKKYELKLDDSYFAVMANDLVNGNQLMTLRELKLFCIVVSQIVKEDKDFKTYRTTAHQLAEFLRLKSANSLYNDFDEICSNLSTRRIGIKQPQNEKFTYIPLFSIASYDKGEIVFKLNEELKPYLLQLQSHYTQVFMETVLGFNNYFGLRLYIYLLAQKGADPFFDGRFELSVEEIKQIFGQEKNEYYQSHTRQLLDRTIIPALEDINNSDCASVYNYREIKSEGRGKKIVGVEFYIRFMNPEKRTSYNFLKQHDWKSEKDVWLNEALPRHRKIYEIVVFDEYLKSKEKKSNKNNANVKTDSDTEGDNSTK